MAFHDAVVNVVVLLAKFRISNSNVFGIAGEGPLWSLHAYANSVSIRECAANAEYRVPRGGSNRDLIAIFGNRSALVRILSTSERRTYQ